MALCAACAGVALTFISPWAPPPATILALSGLLALCAAFSGRLPARALFLASLAALFWGWTAHRAVEIPADSVAHLLGPAPTPLRFEGVVASAPRESARASGEFAEHSYLGEATRFTVRVTRVLGAAEGGEEESAAASGRLFVRVDEALLGIGLRPGDRLRVSGAARGIAAPRNPGEADRRPALRQRGIVGAVVVPRAALIEKIDAPRSPAARVVAGFERVRSRARERASRLLDRSLADRASVEEQGLLRALLLGEREDIDELSAAFRRVGLAHTLSISGLHLGLIAWAAHLLLRTLGVSGPWRAAAVALVVASYMLLVPARTPVLRSGAMVLAYLAAECAGRRYSAVAVLSLTATALLAWRPLDLFDPGFQLSFGVVGALLTLSPVLDRRLFGDKETRIGRRTFAQRAGRAAGRATVHSVVAWLVAAPLVIYHFGHASPYGALATLLLLPVFTPLLALGAVSIFVAAVLPGASVVAAPVLAFLASVFAGGVRLIDSAPSSAVYFPAVSISWTLCAFAVITWWIVSGSPRRVGGALATIVFFSWTVFLFARAPLSTNVSLRFDTFAVGDGSCHLVRSGRQAVLHDCGSSFLDIGEREISRALRAVGAWRVRRAIVTHANIDHYAALPALARAVGLRELVTTRAFVDEAARDPHGPAAELLDRLDALGVRATVVSEGDELTLGAVRIKILSPPPDPGADLKSGNNSSLVALYIAPTDAGVRRLLMTGDIEEAAIARLIGAYPGLRAGAMELPHHGSAKPEAVAFVIGVDPTVVVQSTGPSRVDDERWDEARGGRGGRRWLVTARDGAVTVRFNADGSIAHEVFRD